MNLSIIGGSSHMERRLNPNQSNKPSFTLNTSLNPNAAEFVPSSHRPLPGNGNPGTGNSGIGSPNTPEFIPASLKSPTENGNTGFGNPNAPAFIPSFLRSPSGNRNPNAPEFIPASLRSPTGNGNPRNQIPTDLHASKSFKEETLDRSDSNVSNKSDDEVRQYWRVQLPDDLTPDFRPSQEDETISLSSLSMNETGLEAPVLSPSIANNGNRAMWGKQFVNGGKYSMNAREVNAFNGESSASDLLGGNMFSTGEEIKFLSLKYPGFSTQALADIYLKSGRDLSLTLEILNEMESQNMKSKSFVSPNLITLDSPSTPSVNNNLFRTLSTPIRRSTGDSDLSSPFNEINNNNNSNTQWRYNNNRGDGPSLNRIGSSRIYRNLSGINSSFNGNDDVTSGSLGGGSTWLETGDNLGNLHLESKEEIRNLALLRNVCLEQARQAYLSGNESLSKELTLKGQLYNMQIKSAQEKAKEVNRNMLLGEIHNSFNQENQERPIDLRGLHASEAIHVLNYELNNRKRAVRSTGRRLETTILVGSGGSVSVGGNFTRGGVRTPPRLTGDVEQYLFEHGFRCTQTQPGVLRVVLY